MIPGGWERLKGAFRILPTLILSRKAILELHLSVLKLSITKNRSYCFFETYVWHIQEFRFFTNNTYLKYVRLGKY
jgi:hypothetical protein